MSCHDATDGSEVEGFDHARAPFLTIERPRGTVSISSVGNERFRVQAPGHDSDVDGGQRAGTSAHNPLAGACLWDGA
jgi:hypothetical protein